MKDSSNTNQFFDPARDNLHCNENMILPFSEGDVLKIKFEYVFLNPWDINFTIAGPVIADYSFIIKKWQSPITLCEFAYHFSNFFVCKGLGLFQSDFVEWRNITILNQTAKQRLKYTNSTLDLSNPKKAYHFFNVLSGINGQLPDLSLNIKESHLFKFINPVTNKVLAYIPLFFMSSFCFWYDENNHHSLNTEMLNASFLRQTLMENFTMPISISVNNSKSFTLQFINDTDSKTIDLQSRVKSQSIYGGFVQVNLTRSQALYLFPNSLN